MFYEWDEIKALANLEKHGVDFADAVAVFSDDAALTVEEDFSEERWFVTLGMDAFGSLLVIVYTWRGDETTESSLREKQRGRNAGSMRKANEGRIRFQRGQAGAY